MTETEYLLVCLIEECSEVQKAATKSLRFGLSCFNPYQASAGVPVSTNASDLLDECCDVLAIMQMLKEKAVIGNPDRVETKIQAKKDKVRRYLALLQDNKNKTLT